MSTQKFKCVTIGDGEVGKTSLLMTYAMNKFPDEYVPTVFENYNATIEGDNGSYSMILFDTAGQELYKELRQLSYPKADVFLVCFSLVSPQSFDNVSDKWAPELAKCAPNAQIILIGTKSDLVEDLDTLNELRKRQLIPVNSEQVQSVAKEIGALCYMECSAKLLIGVHEVFQRALAACLEPKLPPKKSTSLFCCCRQ